MVAVKTNVQTLAEGEWWPVYKRAVAKLLLIALVLGSAIAVIYVSHLNRRLFNEYQMLVQDRDRMEVEWGQLLLEQSALAAHARIERIAIKRLGMRAPKLNEIVMVQR